MGPHFLQPTQLNFQATSTARQGRPRVWTSSENRKHNSESRLPRPPRLGEAAALVAQLLLSFIYIVCTLLMPLKADCAPALDSALFRKAPRRCERSQHRTADISCGCHDWTLLASLACHQTPQQRELLTPATQGTAHKHRAALQASIAPWKQTAHQP